MKTFINNTLLAVALLSVIALSANAQMAAPFAGGVKLQQGGALNPQFGINMKAAQGLAGDFTLNWAKPTSNGVVKLSGYGATAGDMIVTTLDLSSSTDVGTSVLGIANGGTGATTLNGALNNMLPTQTGNTGKFLTTDGSNTSWTTAVTSVGLSLPAEMVVSNSPVTTTGTLSATWATQGANKIFASPDGTTGTPTFRDMVANDVPNLDASKITTGTFTASQIPNLDASKITTGTLAVAQGGTGASSFTGNGVITSNAAGDGLTSTHLNDGQIMIGSSAGAPVAANLTAGSGITISNAGGSITISSNTNANNKARISLNPSSVSYTGVTPPAGFVLSGTSVINMTIMEAGGYPITATVTNIDTAGNTFDFVISGYPTAGSSALVTFQN